MLTVSVIIANGWGPVFNRAPFSHHRCYAAKGSRVCVLFRAARVRPTGGPLLCINGSWCSHFHLKAILCYNGSSCEGADEHGNRPQGEDIQKRTSGTPRMPNLCISRSSNSGRAAAVVEAIARTAIVVIDTQKWIYSQYDFIFWSINDNSLKRAFLSLQCSIILSLFMFTIILIF